MPVTEIFNDYIENGTAAFVDAPLPGAFFSMLLEMTAGYPAYAVVDASAGNVIEFCWLSAYAPAASFWKTVKITFLLRASMRGRAWENCALTDWRPTPGKWAWKTSLRKFRWKPRKPEITCP
ncbi:hypothetical protein [Akkermansia sp.]|uniref:hypothetical protein n=1 Tax=Akkermansia sp. TaxID=1872421 RepID=UPI003AB04EFE